MKTPTTTDPALMHLIWCRHEYALETAFATHALAANMLYLRQDTELLQALGEIKDETAKEKKLRRHAAA